MARTGIRYEDVKTAATALLARGDGPTIQRIREFLGTGSNTTIAMHLKRWQRERNDQAPQTKLPPALPEDLMPALEAFWQAAVEQAEGALERFREEARQEREHIIEQRDQALSETQRLAQERGQLEQNLKSKQEQLHLRANELNTAQRDGKALQIRNAELNQQIQGLQQALKTAENQLVQAHEQHQQALQACRSESQQQLAEVHAQADASEQRLLQLISELRQEQRQRETQWDQSHREQEKRWSTQLDQQREVLAQTQTKLATQLDQQRETLTQTQTKLATAQEQARATQTRLEQQEQQLGTRQTEKEDLLRSNAKLEQKITEMIQIKEKLGEELSSARQELVELRLLLHKYNHQAQLKRD